jgi:2-methylcitrate dehydratase PrpD
MAERQRATGAELLNAVVLGYDVGTRVVEACGRLFGVKNRFGLNSDFLYTIGGTVAAGRLLGLDADGLCHAMALCTFQSNALCAFYAEDRHISKSFCNGQFAFAAVSAALMAAAGLEGHRDIIGAPYGVLHAWGAEGRRDAVVEGLGERHTIMSANFKMLNAGYPIHAPVEAALSLRAEHGITPDTIETLTVGLPSLAMKVVDNRDMHNICVQDMVCAAVVQGGIRLRHSPFPQILADPDYQRLRARIVVHGHPDLDRDQPEGRGAIVTIGTASGASFTRRVEHPKGHSLRGGLSWADLSTKWHEGLAECDVDRMLAMAQRLDEVEDVAQFLDTLEVRP